MSDILHSVLGRPADRWEGRRAAETAAQHVLRWLEQWMAAHKAKAGDTLPTELEIAQATGAARSSVREALTAMKALGLIRSRRRGGIRLLREPVLLELRHYYAARLGSPARRAEAMEVRAALEWGLGPVVFEQARPADLAALRRIIEEVACLDTRWADIHDAEVAFHTTLTATAGNRLAGLLAHLYGPIFRGDPRRQSLQPAPADVRLWTRQHEALVGALESRDRRRFLHHLRRHTHSYMRLGGPRGPGMGSGE